MARSRNIKPGFFRNEQLVELAFEYRILFAGLWSVADREGRLEDRPKKIKMEVFPADSVNVEEGLILLAKAELIDRYEVDGVRYIQVTNFAQHQKPHVNEKPSAIPPKSTTLVVLENNQGDDEHALIPDSLLLIPDSLLLESETGGDLPDENESTAKPETPAAKLRPNDEVLLWLDAIAPITGAKSRKTLANFAAWDRFVRACLSENRRLEVVLGKIKGELERNKGTPQYFSPDSVLKVVQASAVSNGNGKPKGNTLDFQLPDLPVVVVDDTPKPKERFD